MFLTKKSNYNISNILKCVNINFNDIKYKRNNLMIKIYNIFKTIEKKSNKIKLTGDKIYDDIYIKNIASKLNDSKFIDRTVLSYIDQYINICNSYKFKIGNTIIKLNFLYLTTSEQTSNNYDKYINNSIKYILHWLYICKLLCNINLKNLNIDIYFTPLMKKLPNLKGDIITSANVNSGYSSYKFNESYKRDIIIYRHEEWFKVLLHETIHVFDLDFKNINTDDTKLKLMNHFKIFNSDYEFNETYCEFWACIMNNFYYSYYNSNGNLKKTLLTFEINCQIERYFSLKQMKKVLSHYNIDYNNLFDENYTNSMKYLYKENTNVLCYYILKSILMFNYDKIINWCNYKNLNLINFNENKTNTKEFGKLIIKYSTDKKFLKDISNINIKPDNNKLEMSAIEIVF